MFVVSLILYAVLGIVLSKSGVSVVENTGNYLAIMALVVGIDIVSSIRKS